MKQMISEGAIPLLFQNSAAFFAAFAAGYVLTALLAYLLGSVNFALVVSAKKYKDDIRSHGSGNAGMTNMLRTYGKSAAALTILGDALKAVIAVFLGWCLMGMHFGGGYIAALFCIIGHVYPCFFRFKGGKGVVTAAVSILMLNPVVFSVILSLFVIIVALTRYISLGSVICAALYPLLTYISIPVQSRGFAFIFSMVIAAFIIYLHRGNLKRLAHGEESKFSLKSKKKPGISDRPGEKKTYRVKKGKKQ